MSRLTQGAGARASGGPHDALSDGWTPPAPG